MNQSIRIAINERRLVKLDYGPGERLIEPHAYGVGSNGNELLRAFQVSGASASGKPQHWKLFRVDQINALAVLEERFEYPRPGYRQNDSAMGGGIFSQL